MHRRRRQFSVPFVLVIGCGAPQTPDAPTSHLPEPPGSGAVTRSTTEDGIVVLAYESGDKVYVHENGTCFAEYAASCGRSDDDDSKPEPMTCNPPPPQQVKCPAAK